jgi:ribonuclease R
VDFETTETQIVCDDNGRIEKIVPRTRNDAHKLIEEAMLAANVCSADFIEQGGQPGLFRVHEGPTLKSRKSCATISRPWRWACRSATTPSPRVPGHCRGHQDRPDAQQIHTMLLRSMQQAIYTPINSGHFGWPLRPTPTSPARFAATQTCWCTA